MAGSKDNDSCIRCASRSIGRECTGNPQPARLLGSPDSAAVMIRRGIVRQITRVGRACRTDVPVGLQPPSLAQPPRQCQEP
jgi:hypothetical protein